MKTRLWRVLSGRILVRILDIQYNDWEKRASRCKEKSPLRGRKRARERLVALKRETLDAKRSPPSGGGREQGKG